MSRVALEDHTGPDKLLGALAGGLVVSCQAELGASLDVATGAALMASCAACGGAVGIRTNGPDSVRAVRSVVSLPVIGLHKVQGERRMTITPSIELARGLAEAGAAIIAAEFTADTGTDVPERIAAFREVGVRVMADISTFEEGVAAWVAGADLVGTTLSGYTPYTRSSSNDPDLDLVARLSAAGVRVVAEGRLATPTHVQAAFAAGAFAVVVGGAITDPIRLTAQLVTATRRSAGHIDAVVHRSREGRE